MSHINPLISYRHNRYRQFSLSYISKQKLTCNLFPHAKNTKLSTLTITDSFLCFFACGSSSLFIPSRFLEDTSPYCRSRHMISGLGSIFCSLHNRKPSIPIFSNSLKSSDFDNVFNGVSASVEPRTGLSLSWNCSRILISSESVLRF